MSEIKIEKLFTMDADTGTRIQIPGGPQGGRLVVAVTGGTFEGERLRGSIAAQPGGDWLTMRDDGSYKLDVRLILETDDGASILMTYTGVGVPGEGTRSAPLFETGDDRYTWLNRVQAVGIGTPRQGGIKYEVYQLL